MIRTSPPSLGGAVLRRGAAVVLAGVTCLLLASCACGPVREPKPTPAGCLRQHEGRVRRPDEDLAAGLAALREGRGAVARRLLDCARDGFLKQNLRESVVALQVRALVNEQDGRVTVSADDRLRATPAELSDRSDAARRRRTLARRAPYATFNRSPWQPRYLLAEGEDVLEDPVQGGIVVVSGQPLRLIDDRGRHVLSQARGWSPVATPHGVAFLEGMPGAAGARAVLYDRAKGARLAEQAQVPWSETQRPWLRLTQRGLLRAMVSGQGVVWLQLPDLAVAATSMTVAVGLSRDEAAVATVSHGDEPTREVKLFDAHTGRLLRRTAMKLGPGSISGVAVHPGGEVIAVSAVHEKGSSVHVLDLTSGRPPWVARRDETHHAEPELTPDGHHLVWRHPAGGDAKVFDIRRWRELPGAHADGLFPAKTSTFYPWKHAAFGPQLRSLATPRFIPDVALGQKSIAWASAHPGESFLNLWSARHGWRLRSDEPHCHPALGPGDNAIAAVRGCKEQRATSQLIVHRLDTSERLTIEVPFRVTGLALSARGARLLAWGEDDRAALFEPFATGAIAWDPPAAIVRPVIIAPDGTSAVQRWATHLDLMRLPAASSSQQPALQDPMVRSIPCPRDEPVRYQDAHTVQCGSALIDLRNPRAARKPAPRRASHLTADEGIVTLVGADKQPLARILSDGTRGAFAYLSSGMLDPLGDAHPALSCRYGHLLTPLAVCAERRVEEGILAKAWTP